MTIIDQPPPKSGQVDVWPLVLADLQCLGRDVASLQQDMEERVAVGLERYGTPLQTHNGRDALVDAYQEALDGVMYLRQELAERCDSSGRGLADIRQVYIQALNLAASLRDAISSRSGGE